MSIFFKELGEKCSQVSKNLDETGKRVSKEVKNHYAFAAKEKMVSILTTDNKKEFRKSLNDLKMYLETSYKGQVTLVSPSKK